MSKRTSKKVLDLGGDRESNFEDCWRSFSSNLFGELISSTDETRFLRVVQRGEDDWMAVLAISTEDNEHLVAFGNGNTFVMALTSLAGSLSADSWQDDKFYKERK
jgi:hypothetical protein